MNNYKILQNIALVVSFIFFISSISMGILSQIYENENYGIAFAIFTILFMLSFFLTLILCCFKNQNNEN